MKIIYAPAFVKQFKKLPPDLQEEVIEKIELLKEHINHKNLRVHKLHGYLKECYSFSVNYKTRIVFSFLSKTEVALLIIGDHDIYK